MGIEALISSRADGSFVASIGGMSYHILDNVEFCPPELWLEALQIVERDGMPPLEEAPIIEPPPVLTRTYKADIWRRASEVEAEFIDAALAAQPARLRNLWRDSAYLDTGDELYPMVEAAFVAEFGPTRAAELLAPTE